MAVEKKLGASVYEESGAYIHFCTQFSGANALDNVN